MNDKNKRNELIIILSLLGYMMLTNPMLVLDCHTKLLLIYDMACCNLPQHISFTQERIPFPRENDRCCPLSWLPSLDGAKPLPLDQISVFVTDQKHKIDL